MNRGLDIDNTRDLKLYILILDHYKQQMKGFVDTCENRYRNKQ